MIRDLPHYFNTAAAPEFVGMDVAGAMAFNREDSTLTCPTDKPASKASWRTPSPRADWTASSPFFMRKVGGF